MTTPTTEQGTELNRPHAPVPAADDPRRGQEVFAPTDGPFEKPATELEEGPLFVDVEERLPEVAERELAEGEQDAGEKKGKFPLDRRDFMRFFTATAAASTAACVRRPVEYAVPYVNQPIDQAPGIPTYYATTCGECSSGCGVMVKTNEGRPSKLEGLPTHPMNSGGLCSTGQASLQGLYHPERAKGPKARFGKILDEVTWDDAYQLLGERLKGKRVGIFTGGSTGNRLDFYREWLQQIGSDSKHVYTYEPNALIEATIVAHQRAYGVNVLPRTDLQNAQVIVGIGSDVLDVGPALVYHTKAYARSQSYNAGQRGKSIQFESSMTLTGGKADERHVIPPGGETLTALALIKALLAHPQVKGSAGVKANAQKLLDKHSTTVATAYDRLGVSEDVFTALAETMLAEQAVVLAGGSHAADENLINLQLAAIVANELIGAYGTVMRLDRGWKVPPVKQGDLARFMAEVSELDALIVIESNPAFTLPESAGFKSAVAGLETVVSMQSFPNETDKLADFVLPNHHYLESWGDEQPVAGFWSARQPAVRPLTNSRQAEDVLLWLAATVEAPMGYREYRDYLDKRWQSVHAVIGTATSYKVFRQAVLNRGFVGKLATQTTGDLADLSTSFNYIDKLQPGLKLLTPLDPRLLDGRGANKPVLQEVGHPLTSVAWDSFVMVNPDTARKLGIRRNDLVHLETSAGKIAAAVYPMPGLHPEAIVLPRGNGHDEGTGTIEGGNGVDPLKVVAKAEVYMSGSPATCGQPVKITATGERYRLAAMQKGTDISNRTDIVKTMPLSKARQGKSYKYYFNLVDDYDKIPDLYPEHPKKEYSWGLSIDLDKCTGCGACMVACAQENNVPQVGREQVLMGREMHWIRLDRYFQGPVDNPEMTLQAMLCQQCHHAPCEAVCPVFATVHDNEGVNAMVYNRCVGTRYCANACPYKVRRFNWYTHKWNQIDKDPKNRNIRALNPDVTVRTRGVMEKCNFCYQRLRDAKHAAKVAGRPMADGEVQTACQQTCPADSIVFGNLNDPASRIRQVRSDPRAYLALGGEPGHGHYGIKTLPSVSYMQKVTFKEKAVAHKKDDHGSDSDHG